MAYRRTVINLLHFNTLDGVFRKYKNLACTISPYGVNLSTICFRVPEKKKKTLVIIGDTPGDLRKTKHTYSMWTEAPDEPDMKAFQAFVAEGLQQMLIFRRDKAYDILYDAVKDYYKQMQLLDGYRDEARYIINQQISAFPFSKKGDALDE